MFFIPAVINAVLAFTLIGFNNQSFSLFHTVLLLICSYACYFLMVYNYNKCKITWKQTTATVLRFQMLFLFIFAIVLAIMFIPKVKSSPILLMPLLFVISGFCAATVVFYITKKETFKNNKEE